MSGNEIDFEEARPQLMRLAYRMLGSISDAEDVVQEAYLRWTRADKGAVQSGRAYLNSIVVNICIDQHRSLAARKERYVGPWLPEPVVEYGDPADLAESVSLALMVVLETLVPLERAAYLLRKVFNYEYSEIAEILAKNEAACRQLVSRAEARIQERRPRFDVGASDIERITANFMQACATGDLDGLRALLAEDVIAYSDGGGKVLAALAPIEGADRVSRFFVGITKKSPSNVEFQQVTVNGLRGILVMHEGQILTVLSLDISDGKIVNCYLIRNPEKLVHISRQPFH